ncbi:type IV secretory system conjugative DNA transfer family protein [Yersinia ruckeri]|nr:type IV secretory system conjugative DNA transfer family protein [Yersinia ruckeri]
MSVEIESKNIDKQPCILSAKGVGIVIPYLVSFPNPVVVLDPHFDDFKKVIFQSEMDKNK